MGLLRNRKKNKKKRPLRQAIDNAVTASENANALINNADITLDKIDEIVEDINEKRCINVEIKSGLVNFLSGVILEVLPISDEQKESLGKITESYSHLELKIKLPVTEEEEKNE